MNVVLPINILLRIRGMMRVRVLVHVRVCTYLQGVSTAAAWEPSCRVDVVLWPRRTRNRGARQGGAARSPSKISARGSRRRHHHCWTFRRSWSSARSDGGVDVGRRSGAVAWETGTAGGTVAVLLSSSKSVDGGEEQQGVQGARSVSLFFPPFLPLLSWLN